MPSGPLPANTSPMAKRTIILYGFILLKFLLQYVLCNPAYDLQRDEYLHLDQANHLAWGYASVPPITSLISCVIRLLGNSVFWIRFFPALFGALTLVVVWKAIEELKGNLFALVTGATCVLFSALLRLNFLFQPNSMDVLSWTTVYFLLIKYVNSPNRKWLFLISAASAIGFLNKYNIVFLLIGLLPALVLTRQRGLFLTKGIFFPVALFLLLILPNLLWQYHNHFPVFHHLQKLADTQLVNVNRWDFFKEQAYFFLGALPVIIASLYALLCHALFRKFSFFFWAFIFTLAVFVWLRAKSYYAMGLYPIYISFGAVFLGNVLQTGWKRYLRPVIIAIPILLYLLLFKLVFSVQSPADIVRHRTNYQKFGLLRWEDGKEHALPQDFADMLGWKELVAKVDSIYAKLPNREGTLVLCDNYGQAGAINYYTRQGIRAMSFDADYINWFDLTHAYSNLIRVKWADARGNEMQETSPYFQTALVADSVSNAYAREFGCTIFAFTGAKVDIRKRIEDEIERTRNGE